MTVSKEILLSEQALMLWGLIRKQLNMRTIEFLCPYRQLLALNPL